MNCCILLIPLKKKKKKRKYTECTLSQFLLLFFWFLDCEYSSKSTVWRLCLVYKESYSCIIGAQKIRHSTFSERSVYRNLGNCALTQALRKAACVSLVAALWKFTCGEALLTTNKLPNTFEMKICWLKWASWSLQLLATILQKQLEHLWSLCRSCCFNNRDNFKYLNQKYLMV